MDQVRLSVVVVTMFLMIPTSTGDLCDISHIGTWSGYSETVNKIYTITNKTSNYSCNNSDSVSWQSYVSVLGNLIELQRLYGGHKCLSMSSEFQGICGHQNVIVTKELVDW